MCCADFYSGTQLHALLKKEHGAKAMDGVHLHGVDIDLRRGTSEGEGVTLHQGNVIDFQLPASIDLLTGIQCLRYLSMAERKSAIGNWYNALPVGAVFGMDYVSSWISAAGQDFLPFLQNRFGESVSIKNPRVGKERDIYPNYFSVSIVKPTEKNPYPLGYLQKPVFYRGE